MKVVFLDFDGVLNTLSTPAAMIGDWGSEEWLVRQLEPRLVAELNRITDATGAVIVLSTSWRDRHPLNRIRDVMAKAGISGFVIGSTPKAYQYGSPILLPRDREIERWLLPVKSAVEAFVVLDDMEMTIDGIRERSILCDPVDGLTPADVRRAIELLGGAKR